MKQQKKESQETQQGKKLRETPEADLAWARTVAEANLVRAAAEAKADEQDRGRVAEGQSSTGRR